MPDKVIANSKTLTSRLIFFFSGISLVIGLAIFVLVISVIRWSEDRVGERRITIDRDTAISHFLAGEEGKVRLDKLTVAYNDPSLMPKQYRDFLEDKEEFLGEGGDYLEPFSHMIYKSYYMVKGEKKPIILLSLIDAVEFGAYELFWTGFFILIAVALLMVTFGTILHRLSQRLIEPLNDLTYQLENKSGDVQTSFTLSQEAAYEFQLLTKYLNTYRRDLDRTLQREQTFARYASHELRTPLTVVTGATSLLSKKADDEFQSRQLLRIKNASDQMTTMVDALLSIVRYEKSVDNSPIRLFQKDEIKNIVELNAQHAIAKGNRVQLEFIAEPLVRASPAVMNMIIGNLLRNAYSATQDGQIDILITDGTISVEDNGLGLKKQNKQGHGLGLMIVTDLCNRYGWKFSLEESSRGCIATIQLTIKSEQR